MRLGANGVRYYLPEVYSSQQKAGEAWSLLSEEDRQYVVTVRVTKPERRAE